MNALHPVMSQPIHFSVSRISHTDNQEKIRAGRTTTAQKMFVQYLMQLLIFCLNNSCLFPRAVL